MGNDRLAMGLLPKPPNDHETRGTPLTALLRVPLVAMYTED
jgi:hypothetical protein